MKYIILLTIPIILNAQDWSYTADILEKKEENGREVRIFKSTSLGNKQVVIYRDTISIFTNQAKQYIDNQELHLLGPVTMINGTDSLECQNMIFWYEIDSLHAFGNVNFKFKNNYLETDSLIYVKTNGFRGYSFIAKNNSKFYDPEYKIIADQIDYNDNSQYMTLNQKVTITSNERGASGQNVNLAFQDSLIKNMFIKNDAYIYNNHYAIVNDNNYQLFKDEINGSIIEAEFKNKHLENIFVNGMAESKYYVVNDSTYLMGFNEASGDTMVFKYDQINLNKIYIKGDARGIFHPEKNQTKLDSTLSYQAELINYHINDQMTFLKNDVKIQYQNTELTSNTVDVNWEKNILYAYSKDDESAKISSQNQKPMLGKKLEFDLINKRGIISLGETKVRDGIYKSKIIFREEPNIYHMDKSVYTTCDHDHPHYYFKSPKMKMIQGERIITKPLFLYIYDIPIIGLPFAILPSTSGGRQSGWIMPSFGVSNSNGTFFQKLGYYWAPNDYLDSKVLMDFYDQDRIELNTNMRYIKRYNFNGNISSTFKRKLSGTKDISDLFSNQSIQNFDIKWIHNHQIDNTQNININWVYVTSSDFYNDSYDLNSRTQQKLESSAGYSKVWSAYNNRLSLSLSESYDLNKQSEIPECIDSNEDDICEEQEIFYKTRVLPNLRFSHSNSKLFGAGDKWYHSIYYNFSSQFKGYQKIGNRFYNGNINDELYNWIQKDTIVYNNSATHGMNLSVPLKLFQWLNLNPSLNLNEGWIFKYNHNDEEVNGFKRRLIGSFNLSSSTILYGIFQINKFNINSLRHILTPTISLNYTPNFSKPFLGIDLGYFDNEGYDYFSNSMIGSTPTNEIRKINLNITNNFQIKLNDSSQTKLDFMRWNINTGYNFMADEFKLDLIKSRINLNTNKKFNFDFTMYHEPYILDENLNRVNQYASFPTLTYLQGATDLSLFGRQKIIQPDTNEIDSLDRDEESQLYNSNKFFEPEISTSKLWELDIRLGAKLQKSIIDNKVGWDKTIWIQPILKLNLTEQWKITYAGQIDMINNQIVSHNMYLYRSLHCWEFGFKWWPSGNGSGFLLNIRVKSPDLKDIKLKSSGGRLFGL
tara:strand:- start:3978 stop:7268 length:3291 start_codon:yes stop_codon:yes gene_type:complete